MGYNGSEDKKVKGTKKSVIKQKLKFENYIEKLHIKINYIEKTKLTQIVLTKIIRNS